MKSRSSDRTSRRVGRERTQLATGSSSSMPCSVPYLASSASRMAGGSGMGEDLANPRRASRHSIVASPSHPDPSPAPSLSGHRQAQGIRRRVARSLINAGAASASSRSRGPTLASGRGSGLSQRADNSVARRRNPPKPAQRWSGRRPLPVTPPAEWRHGNSCHWPDRHRRAPAPQDLRDAQPVHPDRRERRGRSAPSSRSTSRRSRSWPACSAASTSPCRSLWP